MSKNIQVQKTCKVCGTSFMVHNHRKDIARCCSNFCAGKYNTMKTMARNNIQQAIGHKTCPKCSTKKSLSEFYPNRSTSDKLDVLCSSCKRQEAREYGLSHLAERKAYHEKWIIANRITLKARRRAHYLAHKKESNLATRKTHIRMKYGITLEEYDAMLSSQKNICLICGTYISGRNAHLDHCHKTHKLRGFLCNNCNAGLGMFKDSKLLLTSAIAYLSAQPEHLQTSCKECHEKESSP